MWERARARARPRVPSPRALRVASCVARSRGSNPLFLGVPRRPLRRLALADSDDPECLRRFADASSAEEAASAAEDELRDTVRPFLESNPGVVVARVARVTSPARASSSRGSSRATTAARFLRDAVAPSAPCTSNSAKPSRRARISSASRLPPRSEPSRTATPSRLTPRSTSPSENLRPPRRPLAHPADPRAPFARLSREPVAAASLAQVHKGILRDGRVVAVKIQRPGVYEQVALDMYVFRLLLAGLRAYWKTDTDIPAVADEVGAGLLRELDFRLEAANAGDFARRNGAVTPFLRVPRGVP